MKFLFKLKFMAAAVLAVGVFAFFVLPVKGDAPQAKITRLVGTVKIQRTGSSDWLPGAVGTIVQNQDSLQTQAGAMVVVTFQGSEIRLGQNTTARMEDLTTSSAPVRVRINRGFGWFSVNDPSRRGFSATTPTAIASVRGTKFSLSADDEGTTSC